MNQSFYLDWRRDIGYEEEEEEEEKAPVQYIIINARRAERERGKRDGGLHSRIFCSCRRSTMVLRTKSKVAKADTEKRSHSSNI